MATPKSASLKTPLRSRNVVIEQPQSLLLLCSESSESPQMERRAIITPGFQQPIRIGGAAMELPVAIAANQRFEFDIGTELVTGEGVVFVPTQTGAQAHPVIRIGAPEEQCGAGVAAVIVRVVIAVVEVIIKAEPLGAGAQINAPGAVAIDIAAGSKEHFLAAVAIRKVRCANPTFHLV